AIAFLKELRPCFCREKAKEQAAMNEIKGGIGKVQWLAGVHDAKMGIGYLTVLCPGAGRTSHDLTDIDADHLAVRVLLGHIERPFARSTTDIEHRVYFSEIYRGRHHAHTFCKQMALFCQPRHFRHMFRVCKITGRWFRR